MTVLRSIPAPAEALLGSSALAHVVTRNRDGTPQVSVVWCGVRGDHVYFCAEGSTAKIRNIARDPAVVLSTEDLRGLGAKVDNVLCAIDRSGGNHDKLEAIGLKLDALFTFTV